MNYSLLSAIIFLSLNATAQTNAFRFIEPNISIAYDSTQVKFTNAYSNDFYNKSSIDLTYFKGRKKEAIVHIAARPALPNVPDRRFTDSMMIDGLKEVNKEVKMGLQVVKYDKVARHINSFSCAGFVMYDKAHNAYGVNITCNHLSENDATEVNYTSFTDSSLETGYQRLTALLPGFKSYSKAEIQKEEEEIKNAYKVVVKKLENKNDVEFKLMKYTFYGLVDITPTPSHKISCVMMNTGGAGQQIFSPEKDNTIFITSSDQYAEGVIKKKGTLVLLNSFGKKVEIPFTFEYTK